ncbi:MAG TPA: phage terminase large subunit [Methanotrichaceae archaeon]|nr:phage terminase large subunit [Methanotrichaceae archaeon]
MIFTHPRAGKSELGSRMFPAYAFGRNPDLQIIATSYGSDLASRMNRDVQRIIVSPQYKEVFPETALSEKNIRNTSQGNYLRNNDIFEIVGHSGVYRSGGVGSGITGMGYDIGVIDDPVKDRAQAESPTYRENAWDWFKSTFYTRAEKNPRMLVILTRWHSDDLAGRLLKAADEDPDAEQWEVLNLPAIAEAPVPSYDPRKPGEALWPWKYDEAALKKKCAMVGPYEWEAMWQQRPPDSKYSLFNLEVIENYLIDPATVDLRKCIMYGAFDPSEGGHDYAGIPTIAVLPDNRWLVWDCDLEVDSQGDSIDKIIAAQIQFNYRLFMIEANSLGIAKSAYDKGKLSTFELQLRTAQKEAGVVVPYQLFWSTSNKEGRIRSLQPHYYNGQLCFRSDWAKKYKKLMMMFKGFPNADFDDGPDSIEMAISGILGNRAREPPVWEPPISSPSAFQSAYSGPY